MLLAYMRRSLSYVLYSMTVLTVCLFIQSYYFSHNRDPLLVIYRIASAFYGTGATP